MSFIRPIAIFFVLSFGAHFFAGVMQQSGNNGFSEPQSISFQQLTDEGSSQNNYVNVEDCVPGVPIPFYGEEFDYTFIPIFQNRLGRLIFEETQNHLNGFLVGGFAIVAGGAVGYFVNPLIGIAVAGIGVLVGVVSEITEGSGKKRFCVHESGVNIERKGKVTELAYDDVESFTFQVTHMYYNGSYKGTRYDLVVCQDQTRTDQ